jgi:hypothetical protein
MQGLLRSLPFVLASLTAGCTSATSLVASPATGSASVIADSTPRPMDEITCESLLTRAEIEAMMGAEVVEVGRRASSCYWLLDGQMTQVAFNTSNAVPHWRELLLEDYTMRLQVPGSEVWAEPNGGSVAAFAGGRGVIIHGVSDQEAAVGLALLALARL